MKKKILLGSDFMFNEELGSRLRGVGYDVVIFGSQEDLLSKTDNEVPDLIILDLEKENLGSLASLEIIIQKQIPVICLVQHVSVDLKQKAIDLGADRVIHNSQTSAKIEDYVNSIIS